MYESLFPPVSFDYPKKYESVSKVESLLLNKSGQKLIYPPTEKIGVVVLENFLSLGKSTALRFLEWAQQNPDGVVALPTGKTPEYFIKYVIHYLNTWGIDETQKDLEDNGVNPNITLSITLIVFHGHLP